MLRHWDKFTTATATGPCCLFNEMVQTTTNTFYNREQEREAKAQEKGKRKEVRHAQMLATLQGSP